VFIISNQVYYLISLLDYVEQLIVHFLKREYAAFRYWSPFLEQQYYSVQCVICG